MNHTKKTDSKRIEALKELCRSYHYVKLFKQLSEAEFDEMVAFIEDHDDLGHLEFEYAVNRMHINKPKPRNWARMEELLTSCNARVHLKPRSERP